MCQPCRHEWRGPKAGLRQEAPLPMRTSRGGRRFLALQPRIGRADKLLGLVPAYAGVGDGHAVLQSRRITQRLTALPYVALQHEPDYSRVGSTLP